MVMVESHGGNIRPEADSEESPMHNGSHPVKQCFPGRWKDMIWWENILC